MSSYTVKTKSLGLDLESRLQAAVMMIRLLNKERSELVEELTDLRTKHKNLTSSAYDHIPDDYLVCECGEITDCVHFCACSDDYRCLDCDDMVDSDEIIPCSRCNKPLYFCNGIVCQKLKNEKVCDSCSENK